MTVPPGFHTITPYFFVKGADDFVAFLAAAFDGVETGPRSLRPDGRIANAMVRVGDATAMVSEGSGAFPAMPGSYYLYVDDADATTARAISCGATLVMEVGDMPYGDRQGGVRDAHGNLWWISRRLAPGPYEAGEPLPATDLATWRVLDAAPAQVWRALSDGARLAQWWGPYGFTNTIQEFDFREGGTWRVVMHGPDGADYPNESRFAELVENERLVIHHVSGHEFVLTLTLSAQGSRTRLDWHQRFASADECARVRGFVRAANEQNLDRLAAQLVMMR